MSAIIINIRILLHLLRNDQSNFVVRKIMISNDVLTDNITIKILLHYQSEHIKLYYIFDLVGVQNTLFYTPGLIIWLQSDCIIGF